MNTNDRSQEQETDKTLAEAENLIWALLDENIDPKDVQRLEALIKSDEQILQRYLQCVELHADLNRLFAPPEEPTPNKQSPVLGSLGDAFPMDTRPPVTE
jgi:anti-sigma factor RsiW